MAHFKDELVIRCTPEGWRLTKPLTYVSDQITTHDIVAPANMKTDLASTSIGRWLFPSNEPGYAPAAVIHDFLCKEKTGVPRQYADRVFNEALKVCGVPTWKRLCMFAWVRVQGVVKGFFGSLNK